MTNLAETNGNLLLMQLAGGRPLARGPLPRHSRTRSGSENRGLSPGPVTDNEGRTLEKSVELDRFLADVERRAFRMAQIAVRNPDDALDIVQDAMMQLARRYSTKPADEWPPLFYRILNNRIRDFQRHATVRSRVLAFLPGTQARRDGAPSYDVTQQAEDVGRPGPQQQLALDGTMDALEAAVGALPARQREAFLLRTLQCLDVRATARAMGCSQGSVKTHYFRALGALRAALGEHWPAKETSS